MMPTRGDYSGAEIHKLFREKRQRRKNARRAVAMLATLYVLLFALNVWLLCR